MSQLVHRIIIIIADYLHFITTCVADVHALLLLFTHVGIDPYAVLVEDGPHGSSTSGVVLASLRVE